MPSRHGPRIVLLAVLGGVPLVGVGLLASTSMPSSGTWSAVLWGVALLAWAVSIVQIHRTVVRPLQTLSNLLGALRGGDYSMRSSQARRDDPLGMVMLETNALADTLREQRLGALEATDLLRTVMSEIAVAVFAFDDQARLRLVNRAGERLLGTPRERLEGADADALGLRELLEGPAPRIVEMAFAGGNGRGEIRRSSFRQGGRPHTLLMLADLSRALRQEELNAWRRLVRVIGHEINNSLTPIASVSATLGRYAEAENRPQGWEQDLRDGLELIESRSLSLARFMGAYAKLARLPEPQRSEVELEALVRRITALDDRLEVQVEPGPEVVLDADPDQLEQLLINLVRNGVDAVTETGAEQVTVTWGIEGQQVLLRVIDDGPGLANPSNLFVPFFSTKPGGSGIGLALSRQIVESHGGTIELCNREPEQGCEARVRLPVRR
ncbi:MAG: ATP-binding protein [Myxococcota bacterium]